MKYFATIICLTVLTLVACKKEEDKVPEIPEAIAVTEQGSNDETARNEYDQSIENAFEALETTDFGSRDADSGVVLPCGVISVDTTGGKHTIKYGKNCGKKVLSGTIEATLLDSAKKWRDKGAVVQLEYKDYKILFEVNGQTLIFNGTIWVTNVNGGIVFETILLRSTIEHKIRGNINITFDNGETRNWKVFKRKTYAAANGKIENLETHLAADSSGNIAEIGITKAGENFTTTIPVAFKHINCGSGGNTGPFVLVEGKLVFTVNSNSLSAEAGHLLENGAITSVNDCTSKGYKLTWNIGGVVKEEFQHY